MDHKIFLSLYSKLFFFPAHHPKFVSEIGIVRMVRALPHYQGQIWNMIIEMTLLDLEIIQHGTKSTTELLLHRWNCTRAVIY